MSFHLGKYKKLRKPFNDESDGSKDEITEIVHSDCAVFGVTYRLINAGVS